MFVLLAIPKENFKKLNCCRAKAREGGSMDDLEKIEVFGFKRTDALSHKV